MVTVSFLGILAWPLPCLLTALLPMVMSLATVVRIVTGHTDLAVDSNSILGKPS